MADLRWITGSFSGSNPGAPQVTQSASFDEEDVALRLGPRIPIYFTALSFGVGTTIGTYSASSSSAGSSVRSALVGQSLWGTLDVKPLCDWKLELGAAVSGYFNGESCQLGAPTCVASTFSVQAAYEPNRLCELDRSGLFHLDAMTAAGP
jgi:hypothetical protein